MESDTQPKEQFNEYQMVEMDFNTWANAEKDWWRMRIGLLTHSEFGFALAAWKAAEHFYRGRHSTEWRESWKANPNLAIHPNLTTRD